MSDEKTTAIALLDDETISEALLAPANRTTSVSDHMAAILSGIAEKARAVELTTATAKDRGAITALAYKVVQSKTAIERIGKDLTENWRSKTNAVNAQRRVAREQLDDLAAEIRAPLVAWEAEEAKRKHLISERLEMLRMHAGADATSADLTADRDRILAIQTLDDDWAEFIDDARRIRAESLERLEREIPAKRQAEADAAELERLRAEAADARKKEAERMAAEADAEAAREAREAQERDARLKAEADAAAALSRAEAAEKALAAAAEAAKADAERAAAEKLATIEREKVIEKERAANEAARKKNSEKAEEAIAAAICDLFPKEQRAAGLDISATIAAAIFAGKVPHVQVVL